MPPLCFGGSFNPIHWGHIRCAKAVADACRYDRVVLIPTAQPPHKPAAVDLATAQDRLRMCELAAAGSNLFEVSDIEIRRSEVNHTPSYTLDTARELRRSGWESVHWLIGADMLRLLPKWHEPAALLQEVQFIIMARPGWEFDWETMPPEFRHLKSNVIEAPLIDISATEIRRRASQNLPIDDLVPSSVAQYIHEHHLYQRRD